MLSIILAFVIAFTLPDYNADGPGIPVAIKSIYDADTAAVVFAPSKFNKTWQEEKIRLFNIEDSQGVNAPEVRGIQRPQGLISKLWVEQQLAASPEERLVTDGDRGKFGRLLGDFAYRCHPIAHPDEWCLLSKRLVGAGLAEWKDY